VHVLHDGRSTAPATSKANPAPRVRGEFPVVDLSVSVPLALPLVMLLSPVLIVRVLRSGAA
jgi:hypothetical protein